MKMFRVLPTMLAMLAGFAGCRIHADDTFLSNGVKISYVERGQGEPVILIHGWTSSGWINWTLPGTTGLLAKDHKVIVPDMPGHGRSDKPVREDAYGPELVEDVVRLMDHLKIGKAHIVGYSMGGIIAAKLIVRHPDRVLSGTLGGMGWLREGSWEQKFFADHGKDGKPAGVCFRSLAKLALTENEIKSIHVPVLILIGDHDGLKKCYVEPLAPVRPDWRVIEIKEAGHITCPFKPQFREEIRNWLAGQVRR